MQGCLSALELKAKTFLSRCKAYLHHPRNPFFPNTMMLDNDVDNIPFPSLPNKRIRRGERGGRMSIRRLKRHGGDEGDKIRNSNN